MPPLPNNPANRHGRPTRAAHARAALRPPNSRGPSTRAALSLCPPPRYAVGAQGTPETVDAFLLFSLLPASGESQAVASKLAHARVVFASAVASVKSNNPSGLDVGNRAGGALAKLRLCGDHRRWQRDGREAEAGRRSVRESMAMDGVSTERARHPLPASGEPRASGQIVSRRTCGSRAPGLNISKQAICWYNDPLHRTPRCGAGFMRCCRPGIGGKPCPTSSRPACTTSAASASAACCRT